MLLLFKNCCRMLWKPLNWRLYTIWLFLLLLLSQQHGSDCKPTKLNHRIQRRFMWKQMDNTVDGFVDHMMTGARAMKNMIGDFMPSKHSQHNVMDYLPTETTRVKYIIRNPHTKETKVIRIRPSKKVVKIMSYTPKPIMADKPKSMHMMDPERLRKLEKEQELIAEGLIPMKYRERPNYLEYKAEKLVETKETDGKSQSDNNVVSGTIQEFGDSWKPVYTFVDTPAGFSTAKPIMMSPLHTSVVGELLPEPQKQIYDPLQDSREFSEDDAKKSNTYEVTEYTAEETVVQPDYYNQNSQTYRGTVQRQSSLVTETPTLAPKIIEDDSYLLEYKSQRDFVPSRSNYRTIGETTTKSTITTTTTEEPNYPASFLKKYREHHETNYQSKSQQRNKPADTSIVESSWTPSNVTYSRPKTRPAHYQPYDPSYNVQRTKSQKWPPDAEETQQQTASSQTILNTTDAPALQEFTTQSIRYNDNFRKNVRLKIQHHPIQEEHNFRNVKQRGSVKFGDRLERE